MKKFIAVVLMLTILVGGVVLSSKDVFASKYDSVDDAPVVLIH